METGFQNIAGMFQADTDIVNKVIADVATEDWFRKPGEDSNHLLWVFGHVIVHRGHTLRLLGGQWKAPWSPLFERGAQRVADDQYPSTDELKTAWQQVSADLLTALGNPPADQLANAAPAGFPTFDGRASGTVSVLAFHDAYHTGQISFLLKWLGYGQTVG